MALLDLQEAMGHADPRTTRRYMPIDYHPDRDPAHVLSGRRVLAASAVAAVSPADGVTRENDSR